VQAKYLLCILAFKPVYQNSTAYCPCHCFPFEVMPILQSSAASDGRSSTAILAAVNQVHQSRYCSTGLLRPDQDGHHLCTCRSPPHTGVDLQQTPMLNALTTHTATQTSKFHCSQCGFDPQVKRLTFTGNRTLSALTQYITNYTVSWAYAPCVSPCTQGPQPPS